MIAWHFTSKTLRDGRELPKDGVWLEYTGDVRICVSGLHADLNPFDALQYAPGATLCLVEIDDIVERQDDKLVCRRRKIIARMDATDLCRYFIRMQALSVIHLWDAPDIVCDYLMTGEESIRDAARDTALAASAAARAAAWAAWDAAWDAALTVGVAARAATWADAWAAAGDAGDVALAAEVAAKNEFTQLVYECFEDYL